MNIFETIKHQINGMPRVKRNGGRIVLTASHRLPSSGNES